MEKIVISEFYGLSTDEWEPVLVQRGKEKGNHPTVQKNGDVYVDKTQYGKDVRIFIRKIGKMKEGV